MAVLDDLLASNKKWADSLKADDAHFFSRLSANQKPQYLWIGCSDSRLGPSASLELPPGEMFVHRNIANLVSASDENCLAVIQFAVEALKVRHIIVCGHFGCGGVSAAMNGTDLDVIESWLRPIRESIRKYDDDLAEFASPQQRFDRLCILNVYEQVANVASTTSVKSAWQNGSDIDVHGWIYSLADGLYQDLGITLDSLDALAKFNVRRPLDHIASAADFV